MSTPIYADGVNLDPLVRMLMFRQELEMRKEHQKIQQADLKLRQESAAHDEQQQAAQQMPALMNFLQASQDPAMAQMTSPAMEMMGNAQVSTGNAMGAMNAVAAPQQVGGHVGPSQIDERRAEMSFDKLMKQVKTNMTEEQFSKFQGAVGLVQQGVPREMVQEYIESESAIADRLKVVAETEEIKDRNASNEYAQKHLAEKYGINVGVDKANETLRSMVMADRAAAQARSLEGLRQQGQKASDITKVEGSMRDNFEKSPVTKTTQNMVASYGRVAQAAARANATNSGPSDQALIFAFINMQDQTAARDSEREALQRSGSIANYVTAKFGKYTEGGVLAPEIRAKIVTAAQDMLAVQKESQAAYTNWYTKIATDAGVDPARVTYDPMAGPMQKVEEEAAKIRVQSARRK